MPPPTTLLFAPPCAHEVQYIYIHTHLYLSRSLSSRQLPHSSVHVANPTTSYLRRTRSPVSTSACSLSPVFLFGLLACSRLFPRLLQQRCTALIVLTATSFCLCPAPFRISCLPPLFPFVRCVFDSVFSGASEQLPHFLGNHLPFATFISDNGCRFPLFCFLADGAHARIPRLPLFSSHLGFAL